jgi:hypothetical protein
MKKSFLVFVMLFIALSFLGCNSTEETTSQVTNQTGDITTTETNNNNQFTISDFYNQFSDYKEHIDSILSNHVVEQSASFRQNITELSLKEMNNEYTETYTREEILDAHYNANFDLVNEDYIEQLINTELFMSDILELLENQEDIPLFEPFHPEGDTSVTYEFIIPEAGYILIDALYNNTHLYLKMGLNDDLLDYQELHYYYSGDSLSPKDSIEMTFNYFKFLEDKEAVYVNYLGDSASLRYTNIQDDEQFVVSKGDNIIEESEYEQSGYVLNVYDREANVRSYLQVIGDEIIGETYDVFDEYGLVYRYDNYDYNDGVKALQINIATATEWDYVVASEYSNDEIDELTGIFLNDGTKLFDGRFSCTYTPNYGFVGIWLELNESVEITNEFFRLNQYGMNLDHPKANIEFLNQIKLDNIEIIKNQLQIDNLDFFAEDLHQQLYNYIDLDIRDDLEGNNKEPIETTGDVEEFLDALEQFNNNLNETSSYQTNNTVTTTIIDDNNNVLTETTIRNFIDFDLMAKYYREYTQVGPSSYVYVIDGTKDQLIEFEIKEVVANYYILSEESTTANFMEAYSEITGSDLSFDDMLDSVKSITQIGDTTFELDVTTAFLGEAGVDMDILLEQQGITGLDKQTILITFKFNEDFTNYEVTYNLENLSFEDYKVEIYSYSLTEIEAVTINSPQDLEYLKYFLPQSIEQAEFDFIFGPGSYVIYKGTSYLKTHLEPGEYSINLNGSNRDPEFTVLDKNLNTLEYDDNRFEATYEGYYYIKITSSAQQDLDVYIRNNPTPVFFEFDLDSENGQFEENISLDWNSFYDINVPSATYDRLLVLNPYLFDENAEHLDPDLLLMAEIEENNYHDSCLLNEQLKPCYLYLPANYDITFELIGYYSGNIGFNYEYVAVPQGEFDNTHTWDDITESLMLWMTDDSPVAHVDFTIEETGTYELNTFYKDFGYSYQEAGLYSSDGTQITYDWDYALTLEPGDYYIEFSPGDTSTLFVLIITEIIKN